jgi:peptidyl-prolyl cis-trans isomerase D
VIITFLIGFSFFDPFRGKARDKDALIFIGDSVVKAEEYQKRLVMMLQLYKMQFKDNFNKKLVNQLRLPENVLQNIVNTNIILAEADKLKITASTSELKEKILTHPWFQVNGKFVGLREYEYFLNRQFGMQTKDFEAQLKEQIIAAKYQDLVTTGMVVDESTLKEKFQSEKDNADLDYILLKPDRIKDTIDVNDTEINAYYQGNKEDFKSAERRAGNVVLLKFDDYKKDITITDKEVFDYFKANKDQFMEQEKIKVSRILLNYDDKNRDEILKKAQDLQARLTRENFAQNAQEFSQDEKAKEGGDHGYFGWKRFSKRENTVIKTMEENEISPAIDTETSFSILWMSEKKEKRQKEFNLVKPIIKGNIEREKLNNLVQEKLTEIYGKVKDLPNMKAEAEKLGVKVIDTGLLKPNEAVKDIEQSSHISRQLFQLKDKEVSAPITLPKGMAVVQLLKIEEPAVEPLEKVKDKVKNEVIRTKKLKRLMTEAESISAQLNKMKDEKEIEKYLKDNEMSATAAAYKRGNRLAYMPVKKGLDDIIFSLEEKKYSAPIDLETALAIVKVKSKKITGPADFEKEKDEYYAQKLDELKNSYFTSYMSKKRDFYEVGYNMELFQEVKNKVMSRVH